MQIEAPVEAVAEGGKITCRILVEVERVITSAFCGYTSAMKDTQLGPANTPKSAPEPLEVDVVIEIPRGGFLKRGSSGQIDFISPLPCPYNYGSVPKFLGLDGDLLDALVLGPRLPPGTRLRVKAWGAVMLTDRGMMDDKLICCANALSQPERENVLRFFSFYAKCKGLLNLWRQRPGRNACEGWCEVEQAMARARPRIDSWQGPPIEF